MGFMGEALRQITVGGAFAVIMLAMMLKFLQTSRNSRNNSSNPSVDSMKLALMETVVPVLDQQSDILRNIQNKFSEQQHTHLLYAKILEATQTEITHMSRKIDRLTYEAENRK